ncbi:MAG: hypothetical protein KDE59_12660, partial [Anaerolineales bacterium]|nr:hypothetical protein [Anaerolineales bacterium]
QEVATQVTATPEPTPDIWADAQALPLLPTDLPMQMEQSSTKQAPLLSYFDRGSGPSLRIMGIDVAELPVAGLPLPLRFRLENDGAVAWARGSQLRLTGRWLAADGLPLKLDGQHAASQISDIVPPGEQSQTVLTLKAPPDEGEFRLDLELELTVAGYEPVQINGATQITVGLPPVQPAVAQDVAGYVEQRVPTKGGQPEVEPELDEPAGEWLFRFGQEWPLTVWPREQVTLELVLENRTRQEIPGGQLWVREWVQKLENEGRDPAGSGLTFDDPIPPGKSATLAVPYQMPRETGDYRWTFELETGTLTAPQPVPSLTNVIRVASDESARAGIADFREENVASRQQTVERVARTIPNLSADEPLRAELLDGIMLAGLVDEDWHVRKAALEGLYELLATDLGPSLPDRARAALAEAYLGESRLEELLKRRMRREVREWGESLLEGLADLIPDPTVAETATPPAGPAVSGTAAEPVRDVTSAAGPADRPDAPPSNTETTPARTSTSSAAARAQANLPPVPPTPPEIQNVQITVNQQLAESEPAGDQDRLTLTISGQSVLAKLRLNGQEFNYASPFSLD